MPNSTANHQKKKKKKKKKKPTKPVHDIGIKGPFATGIIQTVPQEKSQTSEEKKDTPYVPKLVNVPNYPLMYTKYNP